jgi:DNA-binding NtrC family response regulator/tetratricopeptide (TPR) repeat protein
MASFASAQELRQSGRFKEALRELDSASLSPEENLPSQVLRSELLERVGRTGQAKALASSLLARHRLSPPQKSACEYVLGRGALEQGDTEKAIGHFQRSATFAAERNDLERLCRTQYLLMMIVSDRSGPDAVAPLLAEVRANATKLGDPHTTAALHLHVGEMEGRRGLLQSAERHANLGLDILRMYPNVWLESIAENLRLAVAVLGSDFDAARERGQRAADLAAAAGAAGMHRSTLGNLGNLSYAIGDCERAVDHFEHAMRVLPSEGERNNAVLETLARIRLTQGHLDACEELIERIDGSIRTEADRTLYAHRYAELTRVQLLIRRGRADEAFSRIDAVLGLATRSGDRLLSRLGILTKADLLQRAGRQADAMNLLEVSLDTLPQAPPELHAKYEQVLAETALRGEEPNAAKDHHARARRLCQAIQNIPALTDSSRSWDDAVRSVCAEMTVESDERTRNARAVAQSVATLLLHARRSDVVALEVMEILENTCCVVSAVASMVSRDGSKRVLRMIGDTPLSSESHGSQVLRIDSSNGRSTEIELQLTPQIDAAATIHALRLMLAARKELEQTRIEREERSTLWPADELPIDGDRAVISGHMREQMEMARKVAGTTVNVLITGESGTGKEILARAVHTFSDRAHKPFVPFNCTAVPRDLLESQLFGHRRGAFTGADRDHAGLIRNAREGTLFLDEIGELGLDLQPKLLRFLESGEISPLGEQGPLKVNVRIIAATNANLEDAVRDGRFREDLFYRLNVVRLSIRPLRERRDEIPGLVNHFVARAGEEFNKGRLSIAEETMERLLLYRWPGNVRQLQNELRRMVALAEPNSTLPPEAISEAILGAMPIFHPSPINGKEIAVALHDKLLPTLARIECEMIKAAFREHHGKVDAVAKALGISRKGLYLKRQRLGL